MARNFGRNVTRPLTILQVLFLGGLIAFEIGCDNSPAGSGAAIDRKLPQQPKRDSSTVSNEEQDNDSKSNDAASNKPIAPQADTKLPDVPLDPSVDVEGLLASRLSADELSVGWIRLFDGQSLMGWRNAGDADWKVEEGVLVATTGKPGLLVTSVRFSDFELKLEYKGEGRTNSGVFLRTPPIPTNPAIDCLEFNIAPTDNAFPTGSLVMS